MPFGIIGQTGPGMRQVVGFGDRSTERGTFGGEFGARHCNQWALTAYEIGVRLVGSEMCIRDRWKNGGSDPDAVWHHRSDGSSDEAGSGVWGLVHGKGYF